LYSLNFWHPQTLNDTSLVNNGRQTILAPADDRECFFIPLPCHLIEGYQPQQQSQQDYQEQQQQQVEDPLMGPTAFSLHYRIQKENATAARLRAGSAGDPEVADGGEGGFLEEFSFEVSDLLAEEENRRRAELNATRIVADIIRNISRILLVPRCDISHDTSFY
jgi:hypothetical protein